MGELALALALASVFGGPVYAAPAAVPVARAAGVLHPLPIDFTGFVFDPLDGMQKLGVRVVISKQPDASGAESIAVRVYDRRTDAYGNRYWEERTALCRPAVEEPTPSPAYPQEPPPCCVVFDRLHPQVDGNNGEQPQ